MIGKAALLRRRNLGGKKKTRGERKMTGVQRGGWESGI